MFRSRVLVLTAWHRPPAAHTHTGTSQPYSLFSDVFGARTALQYPKALGHTCDEIFDTGEGGLPREHETVHIIEKTKFSMLTPEALPHCHCHPPLRQRSRARVSHTHEGK